MPPPASIGWCLTCGGRGVPRGPSLIDGVWIGTCNPGELDERKPCRSPVTVTLDAALGEAAYGARVERNATRGHARHKPTRPNPNCLICKAGPASSGRLIIGTDTAGTSPAVVATEARTRT